MLFKKSEYMRTQGVALSSPVSTLYTWNAWDHDPPFGDEQQLAFYDSGFPTELFYQLFKIQNKIRNYSINCLKSTDLSTRKRRWYVFIIIILAAINVTVIHQVNWRINTIFITMVTFVLSLQGCASLVDFCQQYMIISITT